MRRSASVSLDRLGPETRQVARDAARKAGVPVEEWLATVGQAEREVDAPAPQRVEVRRKPRPIVEDHAPRTRRRSGQPGPVEVVREDSADSAFASVARWMERAEAQLVESSRTVHEQQERATTAVSEAIALIAHRLDDLDRKIVDGRQASSDATVKAVESLEERLRAAAEAGSTLPEARIDDMLRAFENRIAGLSERLSGTTPRPIGRRGRPPEAELTGAVAEIRERQRELVAEAAPANGHSAAAPRPTPSPAPVAPTADGSQAAALAALRADMARLASQLQAVQSGIAERDALPSSAMTGLQDEIGRLREAIGGLATRSEVGTLERAVRALSSDVSRARAPADLAAIAAPVDLLRVQVGRLSDDVAANVHSRLAADVERLTGKMDEVARSVGGPEGPRELGPLHPLFGELSEIRSRLAEIAEPGRIQSLVHSVGNLEARIASLRAEPMESSAFAALQPILEEIRAGLNAPQPRIEEELDRRFAALGSKLDALREHRPAAASILPSAEILERLEALDAKVERAVVPPRAVSEDAAVMPAMLSELASRMDQVERSGGITDGLDALERQILALAERIDVKDADPTIASLERSMADLVAQIATLRNDIPLEDAVARAARSAIVEGIETEVPAIGTLKHDLADLKANHHASNERIQATMEGVHGALEQLVGRLAAVEAAAGKPARPTTAARTPRPATPDPVPLDDVLLEPGTSRPEPAPATLAAVRAEPDASDIKANFIAAARRAAQAAAAEASAARAPREGKLDVGARIAGSAGRPATTPGSGLVARMRSGLDRHRKPLLLGLAAVVLALGALQAIGGFLGEVPKRTATMQAPAAKEMPDPRTTQSIAPRDSKSATAESTAPSRSAFLDKAAPPATDRFAALPAAETAAPVPAAPVPAGPRVAGMATMSADLGTVPAGLAGLKQAALEGDPASVYDLAARAADGRGMARDGKLAAKLFEKVGSLGIAPAQYRLGNQYEKGIGIARDLTSAKSWYQRAAEGGNIRAMHNLAVLLAESGAEPGKPDYAGAVTWFRKAAEYGVRDSQYNLGVLLARGLGTAQDLAQSYLWFAAAASQGDDDAGRKRDDVAVKMPAKDLEAAKANAARWRAKAAEPAANEMPAPAGQAEASKATTALMGAPMPITPPVRASGRV